jgi:hypothetical protein
MRRFTTVLTVLLGLFPLTFGVRFLFDGPGAGAGYGITAAAGGFFVAKGIRDIVLGLNLLALLQNLDLIGCVLLALLKKGLFLLEIAQRDLQRVCFGLGDRCSDTGRQR